MCVQSRNTSIHVNVIAYVFEEWKKCGNLKSLGTPFLYIHKKLGMRIENDNPKNGM